MTKPEPTGLLHDDANLRHREDRADQGERFLNGRVVGMPEAAHRTWGFRLRAGTSVVHLVTRPPHLRMRSLQRVDTRDVSSLSDDDDSGASDVGDTEDRSDCGSDDGGEEDEDPAEEDTEKPLKFFDGTLEQYMNRPCNIVHNLRQASAFQATDWEALTYPDFHRRFRVVNVKKVSKSDMEHKRVMPCTMRGQPVDQPEFVTVPRFTRQPDTPAPVSYDFLLPHKHGESYWYQTRLLRWPFRNSEPAELLSPGNVQRTLRAECELRGLYPEAQAYLRANDLRPLQGLRAAVYADAHRRHYCEQSIVEMLYDLAVHEGDIECDDATATVEDEDEQRLQEEMQREFDNEPLAFAPTFIHKSTTLPGGEVREHVYWHEPGQPKPHRLKAGQLNAFEKLKHAGDVELRVFLSGEGGMGKTTLVKLLVQYWRSCGKKVLLCASTAKAARLINGHTAHHAFRLRSSDGGFVEANLSHDQQSRHWAWLRTRDIIVIDEISMLSAGALHGIDAALNFVMRTDLTFDHSVRSTHFGGKSLVACVAPLFLTPSLWSPYRLPLTWALVSCGTQCGRPLPTASGGEDVAHRCARLPFHAVAELPLPRAHRALPSGRDGGGVREHAVAPASRAQPSHQGRRQDAEVASVPHGPPVLYLRPVPGRDARAHAQASRRGRGPSRGLQRDLQGAHALPADRRRDRDRRDEGKSGAAQRRPH